MTTIKSNILDFENYHVTQSGKIYNIVTGLVLKQQTLSNGYLRVGLHSHGKQKKKSVHRLVAEAYLPNPQNLPCVMHLDDNPKNNHVSNLQWATHQDNMKDRDSKGRQAKGKRHGNFGLFGENHNCSKLSDIQRKEIRVQHLAGSYTYLELSTMYNVTERHIRNIVKTFKQS